MSVFKDFWNFIQNKVMGGNDYTVTAEDFNNLANSSQAQELRVMEFAIDAGINIIANALSMCEVRTFSKWEEIRKDQYYRWNFEPNKNQSAGEFMHRLVWTLIYRNECLVLKSQTGDYVIADAYNHDCYAFWEDQFRDVVVSQYTPAGTPHPMNLRRTYKASEVLFYRLNNRNIMELLAVLAEGYNSLLEAAAKKFYRSGGEKAILTIDTAATSSTFGRKADGTPKRYEDVYYELMNKNLQTYYAANTAVLPLFKGFTYDIKSAEATKKSTSEIKDVDDIVSEIYGRVANALQIPPQILKGDVADTAQATRNLVTFAVKPIADLIETENNRKLYGQEVLTGSYQLIDTSRILYNDIKDVSDALAKMVGSSIWSIDEARASIGEPPLNKEWSSKHWMTKNNTEVQAIEGGEIK